jgi:hypothetical protein
MISNRIGTHTDFTRETLLKEPLKSIDDVSMTLRNKYHNIVVSIHHSPEYCNMKPVNPSEIIIIKTYSYDFFFFLLSKAFNNFIDININVSIETIHIWI